MPMPEAELKRKVALVTGASRGIGRAVAVALGRQGYHVLINFLSRKEDALESLRQVNAGGGTGELLPFDVADNAACETAITGWIQTHGSIDVLVNNAGIRKDDLLVWVLPEDWKKIIDTDLTSFYNVTRLVVKEMVLQRRGRIISISSTSGQSGLPGQVSYSAAKAGVIGASKALAQEVGRRSVTVNVVAPGFIETDITEGLDRERILEKIPLRRFGKPEEVAAAAVFLCSAEAAYITGAVINVNGGIYT